MSPKSMENDFFEQLDENCIDFEISEIDAAAKIKRFLHQKGVQNAYEYTNYDIGKELISLLSQLYRLIQKEMPALPQKQAILKSQAKLEQLFGIGYEKICEYFLEDF